MRLCRTETIGPISFYAMLSRFGSARAALEVLPRLARRGERAKTVAAVTRAEAEIELAAVDRAGARLVCWGEPLYPSALATIEDAPPILTVLGEAELLQRPMIAVVGARNASANGRRFARDLAAALGRGGLTVISGLARGSMPRRIWALWRRAALPSSPAASMSSTPRKTAGSTTPWRAKG